MPAELQTEVDPEDPTDAVALAEAAKSPPGWAQAVEGWKEETHVASPF
jgi:hypothetical protein